MSVRVLKKIIPLFANPLCKLLNLSISTNSFPNHWKRAKVTPLHKGGARNDINNLTIARYLFYLSSQKFSKSTWSALSVNSYVKTTYYKSCNQPLGQGTLLKQLWSDFDSNEHGQWRNDRSGFYRFPKSFLDVIDHERLLKKLSIYGATPSSVAWFKSLLSER